MYEIKSVKADECPKSENHTVKQTVIILYWQEDLTDEFVFIDSCATRIIWRFLFLFFNTEIKKKCTSDVYVVGI